MSMTIRPASHAGTWYERNPAKLRQQIDIWLQDVERDSTKASQGSRYAIGPHAGYRFCGPVLAHTYGQLNPSVERVILMGPSHFKYFRGIKTTTFNTFATPIGDLSIDKQVISHLKSKCGVTILDEASDIKEHSWEMHLPYIATLIPHAKIIPLLFGASEATHTDMLLEGLLPLVQEPNTAVVVSSDFCHWGAYFDYTPFASSAPLIFKQIDALDHEAIKLLTDGKGSAEWKAYIKRTGNTICGASPIAFMLRLLEENGLHLKFKELAYTQSSAVRSIKDSSVSYAALVA